MSPIAIGMDLMLAALLTGALWMGWRLNGRLTALRASQADFAKAVMELDAAALRAESGLKALQSAAEEAHDSLLARIDTARSLATRLEKAEASADGAARRAEAAAAEAKAAPASLRDQPLRDPYTRESRQAELRDREPARPPIRGLNPLRDIMAGETAMRSQARHEARTDERPETVQSSPRRRHLADEALFADPEEDGRRLNSLMRMSLARK